MSNPTAAGLTAHKSSQQSARKGREQVLAMMGAALVRAGLGGNVFALRYWLSCFGGPQWKERQVVIDVVSPERDVSDMTDAEIRAEIAELEEKERIAAECRTMAAKFPAPGALQ